MTDCPFCNSSVQQAIFASSENFIAIYNIAPIIPGHTLIIPRKHVVSILLLSEDEMSEMTLFTGKVTRLLIQVFKSEGFNWSVQDQEAAGQSVAHLHMHVLPRHQGDLPNPGDWYPLIKNNFSKILDSQDRERLTSPQMQMIVEHLKKEAIKKGLFYNNE